MVRSRVVLPQPDGPTMATNSPSRTENDTRADRFDLGALLADVGLADPVGGGGAWGIVEVAHEVRPFIPSNQNMARFSSGGEERGEEEPDDGQDDDAGVHGGERVEPLRLQDQVAETRGGAEHLADHHDDQRDRQADAQPGR